MTVMKKTEQKEDAVSPVVGVMLMLVVTIIIAAVVAAFAGGLATSTETAPNAVLDVQIFSAADVGGTMAIASAPDITIDHLGGDPVDTGDLEMKFSWTNPSGTTFYSSYAGSEDAIPYVGGYGSSSVKKALYLNDMTLEGDSKLFGHAVLTTGSHMQTYANYLKQDYLNPEWGGYGTSITHTGSPFMDVILGGSNEFTGTELKYETVNTKDGVFNFPIYHDGIMKEMPVGTAVHVTIIHTPSEQAIYDKVVYVQ